MDKAILFLTVAFVLLFFSACANLRQGNKNRLPQPEKVIFECQGEIYFSDDTHIRAMGSGASRNESAASRMANLDANANLANAVEDYLNKIAAYHDNRRMKEAATEIEWDGESFSREELNRSLANVSTPCSQTLFNDEIYTTIVVVEIPIEQILLD